MSFEQNMDIRKAEYPETINGKTEKANFRRRCRQNFKFENGSLRDYYNYCPCLRPASDDKMIQCDTCMQLVASVTVSIKVPPLKESFCPSCRSINRLSFFHCCFVFRALYRSILHAVLFFMHTVIIICTAVLFFMHTVTIIVI